MNQRERMLAIAVGGMMALGALYFLSSRVSASFADRHKQISQLEKEIQDKEKIVQRGKRAGERIVAYEQRALPGDLNKARSLYQDWLFETAVTRVGLENVKIKTAGGGPAGDVYYRFAFAVYGDGNIEQLTRLLYHFYEFNYLHRIQMLRVEPIKGTKSLKLTMTVEALSLPGAEDREKLGDEPGQRLANPSLTDYADTIIGRNLFGPPNQPPKLSPIGSQKATTKRAMSVAVKASDADALDKLAFNLESDAPEGAKLQVADGKSGQISWTPPQAGTYSMTVRIYDDGFPSKSIAETFQIVVTDPPPPPPPPPPVAVKVPEKPKKLEFDIVARTTFLSSVMAVDGQPRIWLIERTTGRKIELRVGDKFQVGNVRGTVTSIGLKDAHVEIDGKRFPVLLGESLSQGYELSQGEL
jgi:hypothetical protein